MYSVETLDTIIIGIFLGVLLIGFMRILSSTFCQEWEERILNVHPSLLPKYAGGMDMNVHEEVIKNKEVETGCTIHYVTETVDNGPILIQKKCSVGANDTPDSLKKKVQSSIGESQRIEESTYLKPFYFIPKF